MYNKYVYKIIAAAMAVTMCVLIVASTSLELDAIQLPAMPAEALEINSIAGESLTVITDEDVPLASSPTNVLKPVAAGSDTRSGGSATLDYSNSSEGYVMVKAGGGGKYKVQITKQGKKTYTYDLRSDGSYEVYPLTGGNGTYSIGVFKNVSGNQYSQSLSTSISVSLRDSTLPFLYPSQYVNFNAKSKTVAKGAEVASGAKDQLEITSKVYNYVINNITYDKNKAANVKPGYLPNVDSVLAARKGICFDYAAVMATMLRSQGIATRLEVGYVSGGAYHAWISVFINGVGWINNIIYFDGKNWKMMDPTFASSGGQSSGIMQFIGNGKNYSVQYLY